MLRVNPSWLAEEAEAHGFKNGEDVVLDPNYDHNSADWVAQTPSVVVRSATEEQASLERPNHKRCDNKFPANVSDGEGLESPSCFPYAGMGNF